MFHCRAPPATYQRGRLSWTALTLGRAGDRRRHASNCVVLAGRAPKVPYASVGRGHPRTATVDGHARRPVGSAHPERSEGASQARGIASRTCSETRVPRRLLRLQQCRSWLSTRLLPRTVTGTPKLRCARCCSSIASNRVTRCGAVARMISSAGCLASTARIARSGCGSPVSPSASVRPPTACRESRLEPAVTLVSRSGHGRSQGWLFAGGGVEGRNRT